MPRFPAHPLLAVLMVCIAAAASATPTTPDASGPSSADADESERIGEGKLRGPGASGESRTIDLLIDMQQRSAGLEFNDRARAIANRDIRVRQAATPSSPPSPSPPKSPSADNPRQGPQPAPPATKSGLFGAGATPMVQSDRTASVEPRPGVDTGAVMPRRPTTSSNAEPPPLWLLLPREVIEYVRENRTLVMSSVGGLLLVLWAGSALFSRGAATGRGDAGPAPASPDQAFSSGRWSQGRPEARPARHRSRRHRP